MESSGRNSKGLFIACALAGVLLLATNAKAQTETTTETTVRSRTETNAEDGPQRSRNTGAKAGLKGGANFSNFIMDDINDKNARTGFHVGVFGQLFVNEGFAIQPELNYSTKGNKVVTEFGMIDQETKFNLSYIDMPVLAVFKLGDAVEIHAGPYWGYLVGANIDTEGDLGDEFTEIDRDNFENWDYGLAGGVGFNFGNVQLGARYNYGLNKIAKSQAAKTMLGGDTKNSVGQIYLAVNLAGSR